jgi:hypothetical protein
VAEPADRQHNQSGIELCQALMRKTKPVKYTGPEVLHQYVGTADQIPQCRLAGVVLEVEGDGLFVAVCAEEVRGLAVAVERVDERRAPSAGVVTAVGVFHFDDVGAEVPEHHRRVRAGQGTGQVDDRQTAQGTARGFSLPEVIYLDHWIPPA